MSQLGKRAVLMRLTKGMPGEFRQDKDFSEEVQTEHNLGAKSGKWVKALFPPEALKAIKELDGKAEAFHNAVTLPFDKGIGILPAAMIVEYTDRMRDFREKRKMLVESTFIAKYDEFVAWAKQNHNGTFDESLYPPVEEMRTKFYFRTEPLPVPDIQHFESNVKELVGLDAETVNVRIEDATKEGQRELLKRMIEPLQHMAQTLAKEKPRIFDTLVSNIEEIAALAPKMNLTDDAQINAFAAEMKTLAEAVDPDKLRKSVNIRTAAQVKADALFKRVSGYRL